MENLREQLLDKANHLFYLARDKVLQPDPDSSGPTLIYGANKYLFREDLVAQLCDAYVKFCLELIDRGYLSANCVLKANPDIYTEELFSSFEVSLSIASDFSVEEGEVSLYFYFSEKPESEHTFSCFHNDDIYVRSTPFYFSKDDLCNLNYFDDEIEHDLKSFLEF